MDTTQPTSPRSGLDQRRLRSGKRVFVSATACAAAGVSAALGLAWPRASPQCTAPSTTPGQTVITVTQSDTPTVRTLKASWPAAEGRTTLLVLQLNPLDDGPLDAREIDEQGLDGFVIIVPLGRESGVFEFPIDKHQWSLFGTHANVEVFTTDLLSVFVYGPVTSPGKAYRGELIRSHDVTAAMGGRMPWLITSSEGEPTPHFAGINTLGYAVPERGDLVIRSVRELRNKVFSDTVRFAQAQTKPSGGSSP
jgi:hypothetical protein